MESERERLGRLYAEMDDERLLLLDRDRDNLTDDARMALTDALRGRDLALQPERAMEPEPDTVPELERGFAPGIPGVFPGGAVAVEQALDARPEARAGRVSLHTFYDGHELGRACAALDAADLDPVIEPIAGDALSGVPPRFDVWIEAGLEAEAQSVLRESMGLFPLAEQGLEETSPSGFVGVFDTAAEAHAIAAFLSGNGLPASVVAPAPDDPEPAFAVDVAAADHDRALELTAARLGLVQDATELN